MEAVQNGAKKRNLRGNQETKSGPGKFSFFSFHLDLLCKGKCIVDLPLD